MHEIDLACHYLLHVKRLLVTNREPPELSLYTFKPVRRTTFKTPWGKLPNLLGMKLTTDATLLFLSVVNNDIFVSFLCYGGGIWD